MPSLRSGTGRLGSVQTVEERQTSFGPALYVRVSRPDGRPMRWRDVYDTYSRVYPDSWAVEFYPPRAELVDEANVYHLYVLAEPPAGVNIRRR